MHQRFVQRLLAFALVGLLSIGAAVPAFAQDQRDFQILNNSSGPIVNAWIAPSDAADWGPQVLSAPIEPGETRGIVFLYPAPGVCSYDIHLTYADERPDQLNGLDICAVNVITVNDNSIGFE
ncbi:MAG: hypothetical protein HYX52_02600 [Chloroflexi bacterium]|nr:hypothetical protein [Chloroflexota bacterium]